MSAPISPLTESTQQQQSPSSTSTTTTTTTTLPPPVRYSPANPDNPHVFNRVPFTKRLHWLWLWNPDNNPQHIDCGVAVDTLSYFTSHQTQQQQRYYYGTYHGINEAKKDLQVCLHVRSLQQTDFEEATKLLEQRQIEKDYEPEHVWRFRSVPLRFETP